MYPAAVYPMAVADTADKEYGRFGPAGYRRRTGIGSGARHKKA